MVDVDKYTRLGGALVLIAVFSLTILPSAVWAFIVSSPFGWRVHPIRHQMEFHTGVDFSLNYGTVIPALFDGEVVWAAPKGGYGNAVILRHPNKTYTLYGHCATICVVLGQAVKAGDTIAVVGNTGVSTGPHLHLEYWVNNQYVDPMLIWKQTGQSKDAK